MPNINFQNGVGAVEADLLGTTLSHTTSLRQAYNMTWEYSLESLNFIAFTKPNKHKMRSKGFFYNLAGFVFEYFCDSRRISATFAKFCRSFFGVKGFHKILPLLPIVIAKSR